MSNTPKLVKTDKPDKFIVAYIILYLGVRYNIGDIIKVCTSRGACIDEFRR